jgi:NADH:ubiquinone oxidoreductase subunit 5 (subunit L)/multisubunit Na+/H+ antiporter MnhA subunit
LIINHWGLKSYDRLIIKKRVHFFEYKIGLLDFIGFFLFIGAVGKSAQIGLHT